MKRANEPRGSTMPVARVALYALLLTNAGGAMACTSLGQRASLDIDQEVLNDPAPGVVLTGWIGFIPGNVAQILGCAQDALPMEINPSFTGLTAVGTVNYQGETYVTYQFSPTSPLLIFRHAGYAGGGTGGSGFHYTPLTIGTRVSIEGLRRGTNLAINSTFHVAVVSRGGPMQAASASLGTGTTWLRDFPSLVIQHPIRVTLQLRNPTCALSDAGFSMNDVSADVLDAAGSSSPEQTFQVKLQCEAAGAPLKLTLTDANAPTATGSLLRPTANATAQGVHVELLRNGVPVVLGQQWNHGVSGAGAQSIDLQARYARVAGTFRIGVVEGQAVLTADYR
ncbi:MULTISPECIES: fimbrial protein [Stenotrophomonas]|uniref:fimbrial protein n=1 Tax=Stenotrophomonas TaxID=40323 RepID=UPI0022EB095D|nr:MULTISPECIES: fimbrial protein [Stenotrophomonas]MDA3307156.1 fimbrial protein [Stenotrophomonas sp. PI_27]WGS56579.1 fimbrial protein [Stenotrophomonas pavanii]